MRSCHRQNNISSDINNRDSINREWCDYCWTSYSSISCSSPSPHGPYLDLLAQPWYFSAVPHSDRLGFKSRASSQLSHTIKSLCRGWAPALKYQSVWVVSAGIADKCLLNVLFSSDKPLLLLRTLKRSNRPGSPPGIVQVVLCTYVRSSFDSTDSTCLWRCHRSKTGSNQTWRRLTFGCKDIQRVWKKNQLWNSTIPLWNWESAPQQRLFGTYLLGILFHPQEKLLLLDLEAIE